MTYGVYMAATKLKHYFEEHPMKVVSEAPISDIMCNKDASGRIAKWAIQISPYVPVYERRDAIKSQALADFLVDWAEMQYKPPDQRIEYWKMHFDGSNLKEGLGAGVVLTSPGDHLRYVLQGTGGCSGKLGGPSNSGTTVPIPEEMMLVDSMEIDAPVFLVREIPSWVKPIKEFLINGTLPADENESRRIQRRSKAYTFINGEVYRERYRCPSKMRGTGGRKKCLRKFTKENVGIMLHQGR
ncbi:hypothetical protein QYE76_014338 [Lolium multiflorum]|uniref:Uncharacterized protein n=1 Tax=Lolium multiflorum TaxID=4521 RepID=A0AAD8U0H8_LOLMU|nr:hypothetical protein QYE76_014338 [Lolium multiflorum]